MQAQASQGATLILTNGNFATLDREQPQASAVAIRDGRFLAVGSMEDVMRHRAAATEVIDLNGRTVIPGLNDSHIHLIRGGLNYNLELRWEGVPSLADALRMLKDQADRTPHPQWVRGAVGLVFQHCLLYTSPSPRDRQKSRMPSSA